MCRLAGVPESARPAVPLALIVQFQAEIGRVRISDHFARVVRRFQKSPDELAERRPLGTGDLDRAVHRRSDCDVGHCGSHVIGPDGLRKSGWQVNRLLDGAKLGDGAYEFVELR